MPATTAAEAAAKAARAEVRLASKERRRKASEKSRAKFREDAFIQRKRDLKTQRENERTVFPMMWKRMSLVSQSRVREGLRSSVDTHSEDPPDTYVRCRRGTTRI